MSNLMAALERQQMLERERLVVKDLHDRGICVGPGGCTICKEQEMSGEEKVTEPSLRQTLSERGSRYGDFGHMGTIAQDIKDVMRRGNSWPLMSHAQREALETIATKVARIVCGDPEFHDSWHDIQGYAKLGEMKCGPRRSSATS